MLAGLLQSVAPTASGAYVSLQINDAAAGRYRRCLNDKSFRHLRYQVISALRRIVLNDLSFRTMQRRVLEVDLAAVGVLTRALTSGGKAGRTKSARSVKGLLNNASSRIFAML